MTHLVPFGLAVTNHDNFIFTHFGDFSRIKNYFFLCPGANLCPFKIDCHAAAA